MKHYKYFFAAGIIILVLIGVYLFSGPRQEPVKAERDPNLLATVGNREIRAEQFRKEAERRSRVRREIDKRSLLDEMIEYEALLVKALEAGLDKDPEIIRSYHNMLIGKLRERILTPRIESITVTDGEIQAHYQERINDYTRPAKARFAMIYMETHSKMSAERLAESEERMEEAREKALKMKDESGDHPSSFIPQHSSFGRLAAEYSEDQSTRYRGGDIGWIEAGRQYRWDPAVLDAGFALETPGEISDVISTDTGIYLVKLIDKRGSSVTPFEKVKARIRHKMILEKQRATEDAFKAEMRAGTPIKIYPENLDPIEMPSMSGLKQDTPPDLP